MKSNKYFIILSSVLLLILCSGLLFYKNLFSIEAPHNKGGISFEEIRYADLQLNISTLILRKELSTDFAKLDLEMKNIKDLINIIKDNQSDNFDQLHTISSIEKYFEEKEKGLLQFKISQAVLRKNIDNLPLLYNELAKNKIKFTIDQHDFYKACVVDALSYVVTKNSETESRIAEDKKILSQILSFSRVPNPTIKKFALAIDTIIKRNNEIDQIIERMKGGAIIDSDISALEKLYNETARSKIKAGERFLLLVYIAVFAYVISLLVLIKKLES